MKTRNGFTLIELMVSVVVMVVAIAAASAVLIAASTFTRNTKNQSDNFDVARLGGSSLEKSVTSAGLFTPGGIYVNVGASPTLISPVYGTSGGAAATDELWAIEPDPNALREPCVDPGAMMPVVADGGTVALNCTATPTLNSSDFLVDSNLTTGALLTPPLTVTANSIASAEPASWGNPPGSGYKQGDVVFRVTPWHYFIKVDDTTGRLALMRHRAKLGTSALAPLMDDDAYNDEVVQPYVEDLQVTYGVSNVTNADPSLYAEVQTLPAAYNPAAVPKTVRISLVAISRQTKQDSSGSGPNLSLVPLLLEDHTTAGVADGYQRAVYVRRLELTNMSPGTL